MALVFKRILCVKQVLEVDLKMKVELVVSFLTILVMTQLQFHHCEAFFFQNRQNNKGRMVANNRNRQNVYGQGISGMNHNRNNLHGAGSHNQRQQVNPIAYKDRQ